MALPFTITDPSFSNLAPSIANMAPQTKTTLTSEFVLAPHKGAAFDQHIGLGELRFGSPSRNDSRIGVDVPPLPIWQNFPAI